MFHPIDTGAFKLVVLRLTDSIKAHPQSRCSKTGARLSAASSTQFSAAHRPLSTLPRQSVRGRASCNVQTFRELPYGPYVLAPSFSGTGLQPFPSELGLIRQKSIGNV
jgi:hypothetical protein